MWPLRADLDGVDRHTGCGRGPVEANQQIAAKRAQDIFHGARIRIRLAQTRLRSEVERLPRA